MDQQFVNNLVATLQQITAPDTDAIQKASESLQKEFYTNSLIIPALIHVLQSHPEVSVRQLAGVEARKLITREWFDEDKISADAKAQIRSALLPSTLAEPDSLVRHTSSRVISAIAKYDVEEGTWPELLPALYQAATSSAVAEREVSVYILYTLLEAQLEPLENATMTLLELLSKTINDPESLQVRVSTLEALGCVADNFEASGIPEGGEATVEAYCSLVPAMVDVLKQVITSNDEKSALQVFNVFSILLNSEASLLSNHFGDLMNFMIHNIVSEQQLADEFRIPALQFIITAVRVKKLRVQALKLGPVMTTVAVKIIADEYRANPEDLEDDDDEEQDTNPASLCLQLIDNMSSNLAPSQVMVPLLEVVPNYIKSSDPAERRAGYMALAVSVEGAPDFVNTQISGILPSVVQGLNDADLSVKVSALQCLYYLSTELRDIISSEHEVLLPLVFNIMDTATALKVGKHACAALDALLESMDRQVITEKYLSSLVPKLLHLLNNTNDLTLKGSIIAALSSAAFSAGKNFLPYFPEIISTLEPFAGLSSNIEELSDLQAELCANSIDALGVIAVAVGKEAFHPYVEPLVEAAYRCMASNNSKLKECGFVFVGSLARFYGRDFTVFVDKIIGEIYKCLDQEEFGGLEDYLEDEAEIGDGEDKDFMEQLHVSSAIVIEKEYATDTLGDLMEASKENFPDIEKALGFLVNQAEHFSEGIRKSTINSLWRAYITWASLDNEAPWTPGFPVDDHANPITAAIGQRVRQATIEGLETETERVVAIAICDRISEGLKAIGPRAILNRDSLNTLCTELVMLLEKQHCSQVNEADEGVEDGEAEPSEYDEVLIDSTLDVVVQLAATLGHYFTPIFPNFLPSILKFCSSNSNSERASSVGALAEIVSSMKQEISNFTEQLMQIFLHRLDDSDIEVRSNAAFGAGLLCYYSQNEAIVAAAYPAITEKLQRLLKKVDESNGDNNSRGLANACGCVSRMAIKSPSNIDISEVVPALLSHLPLVDGMEENTPIFELIVELVRNNEPTIISMRERLVEILAGVFVQEQAARAEAANRPNGELDASEKPFENDEIRTKIIEVLKFFEQGQQGLVSSNSVLSQIL